MRTVQQTISILGCGWLGLPLAGHLLSLHYPVSGSYTTSQKKLELQKWGIKPFLGDMTQPEAIKNEFFNSQTLIITVPPSKGGKDEYPNHLLSILKRAKEAGCKNVLFTSSTAVYKDSVHLIDENSAVQELSSRGNMLLAAERAVREVFPDSSTIVRLAGLIGPKRHPGRFLSGKTDVPGALVPVNYLSLEDGVRIISELIDNQVFGKTYNLVCPDHPSKQEFYSYACELQHLPKPIFQAEQQLQGFKIVSGDLICKETGITYLTTDWRGYLRSL